MLLSHDQLHEQIRQYYKVKDNPERMGQWLINRMPLKLNDPDLFYETDNNIAVHKYQTRYVMATEYETKAWIEARDAEKVPKVNIQDVWDLIQKIEFSTSGADGSCYVTTCILTTNFGFKALGKSGVIHEDRFNEDVCKRIALENAFSSLVENHAYMVRYRLDKEGLTLVRFGSTKPNYVQEDDGA